MKVTACHFTILDNFEHRWRSTYTAFMHEDYKTTTFGPLVAATTIEVRKFEDDIAFQVVGEPSALCEPTMEDILKPIKMPRGADRLLDYYEQGSGVFRLNTL